MYDTLELIARAEKIAGAKMTILISSSLVLSFVMDEVQESSK